ncbi:hypothetical protein V6Z11_A06G103600 [Gossypium hirsutum]
MLASRALRESLNDFLISPISVFFFFFPVKLQINSSSLNEEIGMGCGGLRCLLRESGEGQEWEVMFFFFIRWRLCIAILWFWWGMAITGEDGMGEEWEFVE